MDIAAKLDFVPLPIPSEMRLFVFLASGRDEIVEKRWLQCGGITTFYIEDPEACGICIFRVGADPAVIQPFYDRAGKESNVFLFQPELNNFRRIDPKEFSVTNSFYGKRI